MTKPHQKKEFRIMRGFVLVLFDYSCYLCKHKSLSNEVHHIDGVNTNNYILNLIPLCKNCHKIVTLSSNTIKISKGLIANLIVDYLKRLYQ